MKAKILLPMALSFGLMLALVASQAVAQTTTGIHSLGRRCEGSTLQTGF